MPKRGLDDTVSEDDHPTKAKKSKVDYQQESSPQKSSQKSPEKQKSPQKSPDIQKSPQKTPEKQKSPQKSADIQKSPQKTPEKQKSPQKSPEIQKSPQKSPEKQKSTQKSPEKQKSPQKSTGADKVSAEDRGTDSMKRGSSKFVFFYGNKNVFSQFHPAKFVVDGQEYNCMEQYMHHQKAVTFKDKIRAQLILESKDPKTQKKFGRQVINFDKDVWAAKSQKVVKKGSEHKVPNARTDIYKGSLFPQTIRDWNALPDSLVSSAEGAKNSVDRFTSLYLQNKQMKKALFDTYPKILVEASPRDRLWGIGMGASNPKAKDQANWRGKNLLGYCLTEVRNELMIKEGHTVAHVVERHYLKAKKTK